MSTEDEKMMTIVCTRRLAVLAGAGGLLVVGALVSACGTGEVAPPTSPTTTTSTTTTTTTPQSPPTSEPASPTPKNISPTGGNLFTPSVLAPPAPTEPPGVHRNN